MIEKKIITKNKLCSVGFSSVFKYCSVFTNRMKNKFFLVGIVLFAAVFLFAHGISAEPEITVHTYEDIVILDVGDENVASLIQLFLDPKEDLSEDEILLGAELVGMDKSFQTKLYNEMINADVNTSTIIKTQVNDYIKTLRSGKDLFIDSKKLNKILDEGLNLDQAVNLVYS